MLAGVQLSHRLTAEDGRPHYEPYHVLSLHYGADKPTSIRVQIPVIAAEILQCVDAKTRFLVIKGNVPHFRQYMHFQELINVFAVNQGVAVRLNYDTKLRFPDLPVLAADADRRRGGVTCAL
ncbi:hypothetical protein D3C81_1529100 [compost metagenome]